MPNTLYWKNDTTIYWVTTVEQGERVRDVLFPALEELDFFNNDWLPKKEEREMQAALEEEIPYE